MSIVESLSFTMDQADKIKNKFDKVINFLLKYDLTTINDIIESTNMKFIEVYNILKFLEEYEIIQLK